MKVDTRRLLEECADLYIVCDDGTRIPCSKFHVSKQCQILYWVGEDFGPIRDVPFPGIPSKNLRLALDVIHEISNLNDYSLEDTDAASKGFDVLGCEIDTMPRVWELVQHTATIAQLRARLPKLMRSKGVRRSEVLHRAVTLAPLLHEVLLTARCCEPDPDLAVYLASNLAKFIPPVPLIQMLLDAVPKMTHSHVLHIAGCDGVGTYIHPREVSEILALSRDAIRTTDKESIAAYTFVRAMACATSTYDCVPMSSSTLSGSLIMYHDSQSTSVLVALDGCPPRRMVKMTKWLKFSLLDRAVVVVRAHGIDSASRRARHMDIRMFVKSSQAHAELWYSWSGPSWHPMMDASTSTCSRITGDKTLFDAVVDSGLLSRRMTIRIDVYYGQTSALDRPPLC